MSNPSHVARLSADEKPVLDDFVDEFSQRVGESIGVDLTRDFDVSVYQGRYIPSPHFDGTASRNNFHLELESALAEFRDNVAQYAMQRLAMAPHSLFKLDAKKCEDLETEMFKFVENFFENIQTTIPKPTSASFKASLEGALKATCIDVFNNPNMLDSKTGHAI